MRTLALIGVAAMTLMALAVPSVAAVDRSVTLGRDSRSASWSSPINVGTYLYSSQLTDAKTRCLQGCDETLLQLTSPGTLRLDVNANGPVTHRDVTYLRLVVYRSDAAGTKGKELGGRFFPAKNAQPFIVKGAAAGFYLAEVSWREGVSSYTGKATLAPVRSR